MGDRFFLPRKETGTKRVGLQKGFDIRGDEEIAQILDKILPKEAQNIIRATTAGIAGEISKLAKRNARNMRIPSVIPKAIKSRRKNTRGGDPNKPTSVVFVEHGLGAKNDAWFWHFWEFGTAIRTIKTGRFAGRRVGQIFEQPFIRPAFQSIKAQLPVIIRQQFQNKLLKRIKKVQKQRAAA